MENKQNTPAPTTFREMVEAIDQIENSKQKTALAQIDIVNKDNQRQYEFAVMKERNDTAKWNKGFYFGTVLVVFLTGISTVLLLKGETSIGLGLLSSTFSGVFGYLAGYGSSPKKN